MIAFANPSLLFIKKRKEKNDCIYILVRSSSIYFLIVIFLKFIFYSIRFILIKCIKERIRKYKNTELSFIL